MLDRSKRTPDVPAPIGLVAPPAVSPPIRFTSPHATRTATALLDGLYDTSDQRAWVEFDERYRPIILAVARRLGLGDSDAADVAQETVLQFVRDYRSGAFDRARGRLRHWIIGIARHRVADVRRRAAARGAQRGESAFDQLSTPSELDLIWDQACRRHMLLNALEQLRASGVTGDRSLAILDMLFIRQLTPAQTALELGITAQDVYVHKSRLAQRLRGLLEAQRELFDDPQP